MRDWQPLSGRYQSPIPNNKQALTGAADAGTDAGKRKKVQSVPWLLVILMSAQAVLARGRGHINSRPARGWLLPAAGIAQKTCAQRARTGALARSCCCARELPSKPTKSSCWCANGPFGKRVEVHARCGRGRQKSVISLCFTVSVHPIFLPVLRNFLVCRRRGKAVGQTSTGLCGYWWVN